ncbi:MAG: hypothetical protein ACFE0O_14325 [Opitutales bacterium]
MTTRSLATAALILYGLIIGVEALFGLVVSGLAFGATHSNGPFWLTLLFIFCRLLLGGLLIVFAPMMVGVLVAEDRSNGSQIPLTANGLMQAALPLIAITMLVISLPGSIEAFVEWFGREASPLGNPQPALLLELLPTLLAGGLLVASPAISRLLCRRLN